MACCLGTQEDPKEARERELKRIEGLSPEEKQKRLDRAQWLLPATGCFYEAKDVTQLQDGEERTIKLHVRFFLPANTAAITSTVFYIPGLHAHCNSKAMVKLFQKMAAQNSAVVGLDLPGHGHSEGEAMFLPSFAKVYEVLEGFIETVMGFGDAQHALKAERGLGIPQASLLQMRSKPFFVMGESMGGLITTYLCQRLVKSDSKVAGCFNGAVLVNPCLAVDIPPPPVMWFLKNAVARTIPYRCMPAFISTSGALKITDIMTDPEAQEMCVCDNRPMPEYGWEGPPGGLSWRHGVRWATAIAITDAVDDLEETLRSVSYPFLILHADNDAICPISGSERMMEINEGTKDKSFVKLNGERHALVLNVPDRVVSESMSWIGQHLRKEYA